MMIILSMHRGNCNNISTKYSEKGASVKETKTKEDIQLGLRFKRGVCHAKNTYLKHDLLLNRFERGFLLNRDFGFREVSLKSNYMGFRESVAGIKGAGRDARVVVPNRSVDRAFYIFYTILLCVTGPTPGAIPPYCCV